MLFYFFERFWSVCRVRLQILLVEDTCACVCVCVCVCVPIFLCNDLLEVLLLLLHDLAVIFVCILGVHGRHLFVCGCV